MEPGTHQQRTWLLRHAWKWNFPYRLGTCVLAKMTGPIKLLTFMKTGRLTASITYTGKFQHCDLLDPMCTFVHRHKRCNPFMLLLFSSQIDSKDKILKICSQSWSWTFYNYTMVIRYYCTPFPNNVFYCTSSILKLLNNNLALLSYIFFLKSLLPDFRQK